MAFRNWVTKKVTKAVEEAAEPIRKNVMDAKDIVTNKASLAATILRILICIGIGATMIRNNEDTSRISHLAQPTEPTHITINNYIHEGKDHIDD